MFELTDLSLGLVASKYDRLNLISKWITVLLYIYVFINVGSQLYIAYFLRIHL